MGSVHRAEGGQGVSAGRTCLDCGADISGRHFNAKRCESCVADLDREQSRRWRAANPERGRELDRRWRAANPEKFREQIRRRHAANPERVRERCRRRRAESPERFREKERRRRAESPERFREKERRRRARKLQLLGTVSPNIERVLLRRQHHRCAAPWCRKDIGQRSTWQVDHIMPFKLGGLHDDANLQILCVFCNRSKGGKHPDVWKDEHE